MSSTSSNQSTKSSALDTPKRQDLVDSSLAQAPGGTAYGPKHNPQQASTMWRHTTCGSSPQTRSSSKHSAFSPLILASDPISTAYYSKIPARYNSPTISESSDAASQHAQSSAVITQSVCHAAKVYHVSTIDMPRDRMHVDVSIQSIVEGNVKPNQNIERSLSTSSLVRTTPPCGERPKEPNIAIADTIITKVGHQATFKEIYFHQCLHNSSPVHTTSSAESYR